MKKFSLSSQLVILFVIVLLIASCAFISITITYANSIATKETFNRLSTYVLLVNDKEPEQTPENYPDMNVGYYIKTADNTYLNLQNMENKVSIEDLDNAAAKIKENNKTDKIDYRIGATIRVNKRKINLVLLTHDNMDTFTIVCTDNGYADTLIKSIVGNVTALFFIIMLIAIIIIYMWGNYVTKRIRRIQNHILNLPKNNYESTYLDSFEDEVGDLSRSVEEMRTEIYENESIKQEILHNVSHDFKTPIAVIKTYAEAIVDGVEDSNVSANKIVEQSEILKKKVNRLIQYNRLEYFNTDKEFEDVNMNEIIEDIILNYKYQADNIEFILDLDENVYFKGFSENWYTVVDNIIDNAKRYAKTKIMVVLRENRLRIYNDGEHIEEKFIDKAFKPYEKGSKGQFGLGMSIVQKTVDFFKMNLHVVNEEVGVSFIIDNKIEK